MLVRLTLYLGILAAAAALTEVEQKVEQLQQQVEQLQGSVEQLIQQVQQQQLYVEERTRSEGGSGLKQTRVVTHGTKPYFATSVTTQQVAAIHSHGNTNDTAGLGEFIAVLNGVEFRTRHNDYQMYQPEEITGNQSRTEYNEVKPIIYPEVPPEVTNKITIEEQVEEMQAWFKAWRDQNHGERDYRKYFKPVLCYLEGGWTFSDRDSIDEPFTSSRHKLEAKSWKDLQDKIMFTSSSGKKHRVENYAYLPSAYFNTDNGTTIGQWNYRILCHPLKNDLPLNRLEVIDDVAARMAFGHTLEQHEKTRAARYSLTDKRTKKDQFTRFTLLDKLMAEIPGKDGYYNELQDCTLENDMVNDFVRRQPQKAGYYNRMFKSVTHAMGTDAQYRSFSGETTFMALTTQDKIVPIGYEKCEGVNQTCSTFRQRWTYAIPIEIIYLTPLLTWNPYDIEYKGDFRTDYGASVTGPKKDRNGSRKRPLLGNNNEFFYKTPAEFFDQDPHGGIGDTDVNSVYVMDRNGTAHEVVASGIRIHLPAIKGVGDGELRTRYPIMPFSYEGSPAWKELTALRDILMDPKANSKMFKTEPNFGLQEDNKSQNKKEEPQRPTTVTIKLRSARGQGVGEHQHLIQITSEQLDNLRENLGSTLQVTTTRANGHTHDLTITAITKSRFKYTECDHKALCWDDHPTSLTLQVFG